MNLLGSNPQGPGVSTDEKDVIDMGPPMGAAPGDESRAEIALANVCSALWRIRELLDLLTFKLETEQVLVAAGRSRWLGRATHEVELVLEEIRHAELSRTIELGEVTEALGLDPEISLLELAQAAPVPWDDVLTDHRERLISATAEISALADTNRELLDSSYHALQEALGLLSPTPEPSTYTADGATSPRTTSRLFDQST
jgi:flagellar biosynthesis/type III secretory pathway chaperone